MERASTYLIASVVIAMTAIIAVKAHVADNQPITTVMFFQSPSDGKLLTQFWQLSGKSLVRKTSTTVPVSEIPKSGHRLAAGETVKTAAPDSIVLPTIFDTDLPELNSVFSDETTESSTSADENDESESEDSENDGAEDEDVDEEIPVDFSKLFFPLNIGRTVMREIASANKRISANSVFRKSR